jgi:dTDP-4-dehydrorhamnose reductase
MKVLVAGAGGMVGRAVQEHCTARGDRVFAYDRRSLDITNAEVIGEIFERDRPEVVINCAAWTDVDGCELDPGRSDEVNASGPQKLAAASRSAGALFITISTDYVFDGEKDGFYTQRDQPLPASVYGKSKLAGERLAQETWARTVVVRSGWIFGPGGRNFLSRVIQLAGEGKRLKAIGDAWGTPTYAVDLARRLRQLADVDLPGIYHVVNDGPGASFEVFAREALLAAGGDGSLIEGVRMDSLDRPAPRPRNSRLRCLLSEAIGLAPLPEWRLSLREFAASQELGAGGGG